MDDPTRSLDDRRELASRIRSSRRSEESHMEQLDPCRSQAIVLHVRRCSSSPSHGRSSRHCKSRGSASRIHQGMLDQLVDPTSEHCDVPRSGSRSIIERLTSILGARAHGSRISPRRAVSSRSDSSRRAANDTRSNGIDLARCESSTGLLASLPHATDLASGLEAQERVDRCSRTSEDRRSRRGPCDSSHSASHSHFVGVRRRHAVVHGSRDGDRWSRTRNIGGHVQSRSDGMRDVIRSASESRSSACASGWRVARSLREAETRGRHEGDATLGDSRARGSLDRRRGGSTMGCETSAIVHRVDRSRRRSLRKEADDRGIKVSERVSS